MMRERLRREARMWLLAFSIALPLTVAAMMVMWALGRM